MRDFRPPRIGFGTSVILSDPLIDSEDSVKAMPQLIAAFDLWVGASDCAATDLVCEADCGRMIGFAIATVRSRLCSAAQTDWADTAWTAAPRLVTAKLLTDPVVEPERLEARERPDAEGGQVIAVRVSPTVDGARRPLGLLVALTPVVEVLTRDTRSTRGDAETGLVRRGVFSGLESCTRVT